MGRRLKIQSTRPRESFFTGREHNRAFAYYVTEDEFLIDTEDDAEIDAVAFREYTEAQNEM